MATPITVNTVRARQFVNTATAANLTELRLLTHYLRAAVRTFRTELPGAPELKGGAGWLFVDAARGLTNVSITGSALSFDTIRDAILDLDFCLNAIPGIGAIDRSSANELERFFDGELNSPSLRLDPRNRSALQQAWAKARFTASYYMYLRNVTGAALVQSWFNPSWGSRYAAASELSQEYLTNQYATLVNQGLDRVLNTLDRPSGTRLDPAVFQRSVNEGLSTSRWRARCRLAVFDKSEKTFENWLGDVVQCIPVVGAIAKAHKAMKVLGAGMACFDEGLREVLWLDTLADQIISNGVAQSGWRSANSTTQRELRPAGSTLEVSRGRVRAQALAAEASTSYELTMRALEAAVQQTDVTAGAALADQASASSDEVTAGESATLGALYSAYETAQLITPGLAELLDSTRTVLLEATESRRGAHKAVAGWLATSTGPEQQQALDAIRQAVDGSAAGADLLQRAVGSVLGSTSVPLLVPIRMVCPTVLAEGQQATVQAEYWNLGGGTAEGVTLNAQAQATRLVIQDGDIRTMGSILPGESATASWVVEALFTAAADSDSIVIAPFAIVP
ncbi:MAG: hypothetical protein ACMG6H_08155, partial [Acidobacteriota bacterium]